MSRRRGVSIFPVDKSSDLGCSVYAPSSRFSGASCTSLIPIVRLRRQPVDAGTLTYEEWGRLAQVPSVGRLLMSVTLEEDDVPTRSCAPLRDARL